MEQLHDRLKALGTLRLEVHGPDGELKAFREVENLIVTTGKEGLIDQILESPTVTKPKYIGVGKSGIAPAAGDTALGEPVKRVALSEKTRSGATVTMKATFAAGEATATLNEAGLFTAASLGTMYSRVTFGALTIEAADSLTVTWKYTQE